MQTSADNVSEQNVPDFESTAYPNVPAPARAVLRANRDLIQRFLASDLGRMEARPPAKTMTGSP